MAANIQQKIAVFRRNHQVLFASKTAHLNEGFNKPKALSTQIICERDGVKFLSYFLMAIEHQKSIVLFNPYWQKRELKLLQQQFRITTFDSAEVNLNLLEQQDICHCLIPTGGTSGKIKFAAHTLQTLSASVEGFQEFFELSQVNCFCVLPLYHVSGLMQVMRSLLSEGEFCLGNYDELKQGILPDEDFSDFCISLVPTQLQVLLEVCPEWLARFRLVLIGGAPPWRSLLEKARQFGIRVALTYGMTETASQVVALKPEDFLAGKNCAGQVLPHAEIKLSKSGQISIQTQSLFWGYYPEISRQKKLETDDLGYFDQAGYLFILGRQSQTIISGGENIYPAEVEAAILATDLIFDGAILGLSDDYWGEVVAAVIVLKPGRTAEEIKVAIADQLSRYKQPKKWFVVESLPRNAQGKLNRTLLKAMIGKDYQSLEN
ncbi:MAG: 2-succinylbenzoate--CoA ligase [Limnothrix sp.]